MLSDKFKKYFTDNGIQKKWFAEKIGMAETQLALILMGRNTVPDKYWPQIIELTNGGITIVDLVADKLKRIECIEIKGARHGKECKISLKNFNRTT
jgi:hypothetical protein